MKFDPSIHKYIHRIQRGCHVEWFDGVNKKQTGTVLRVLPNDQVMVTGNIIVDVSKVRILKGKRS